jgi:WD40 repeat protein
LRRFIVVFGLLLLTMSTPGIGSRDANAHASSRGPTTPDTVVVLDSSVSLATLEIALGPSARVVTFDHYGPTRGGFFSEGLALSHAVDVYRSAYARLHPKQSEPRVFAFRADGFLTAEDLGTLADSVVARRQVPDWAVVSVSPPGTTDSPIEPLYSQAGTDSSDTAASANGSKEYPWMSDEGTLDAQVGSGGLRSIRHTLMWNSQADIDAFEEDVYEHDLKLFNDGIVGLRPACDPARENDFWATRDYFVWDSNFPVESGPYSDTEVSDECSIMDLTVGVYHPTALNASTAYEISLETSGAEHIRRSPISLSAQRLPNNCPFKPDLQACINLSLNGISEGLITRGAGCTVPGLHGWDARIEKDCRPPGVTERVSVSSSGIQGEAQSSIVWRSESSTSETGRYIAFESYAGNLVSNDTNGVVDVFVHDRDTGTTRRVSVGPSGEQGVGPSSYPAISADGRFVAFQSWAPNLVPGDQNGLCDVFVHDLQTGLTQRVSRGIAGDPNDFSEDVDISDDGRYVSFVSAASNLVPGDVNAAMDVFVFDTLTSTTAIASTGPLGQGGNGDALNATLSGDGRLVAFTSEATNLTSDNAGIGNQVFLHDLRTRQTQLASLGGPGLGGNNSSFDPSLSRDGRYVTFSSRATDLVAGDSNGREDVFVRDLTNATTQRVSIDTAGGQGNGNSDNATISGDGTVVAFSSVASNLTPIDVNGASDVFLHDRSNGSTTRISVGYLGDDTDRFSGYPSVCPSGDCVAYYSLASNLVAQDSNSAGDVFLFER